MGVAAYVAAWVSCGETSTDQSVLFEISRAVCGVRCWCRLLCYRPRRVMRCLFNGNPEPLEGGGGGGHVEGQARSVVLGISRSVCGGRCSCRAGTYVVKDVVMGRAGSTPRRHYFRDLECPNASHCAYYVSVFYCGGGSGCVALYFLANCWGGCCGAAVVARGHREPVKYLGNLP